MKILRLVSAVAIILTLLIVLSGSLSAQLSNSPKAQEPLDKYSNLVVTLTKRGDTNTVAQIDDLISALEKQRSALDASLYVRFLTYLRSGKTNAAIELIETRLDGAIMQFSHDHDSQYDKMLLRVKEYRTSYPHKSGTPDIDEAVARAFDFLPKKSD